MCSYRLIQPKITLFSGAIHTQFIDFPFIVVVVGCSILLSISYPLASSPKNRKEGKRVSLIQSSFDCLPKQYVSNFRSVHLLTWVLFFLGLRNGTFFNEMQMIPIGFIPELIRQTKVHFYGDGFLLLLSKRAKIKWEPLGHMWTNEVNDNWLDLST